MSNLDFFNIDIPFGEGNIATPIKLGRFWIGIEGDITKKIRQNISVQIDFIHLVITVHCLSCVGSWGTGAYPREIRHKVGWYILDGMPTNFWAQHPHHTHTPKNNKEQFEIQYD